MKIEEMIISYEIGSYQSSFSHHRHSNRGLRDTREDHGVPQIYFIIIAYTVEFYYSRCFLQINSTTYIKYGQVKSYLIPTSFLSSRSPAMYTNSVMETFESHIATLKKHVEVSS